MKIDVSDEIGSLLPVVVDPVENEFVSSIVECPECSDGTAVDVTTVELEFTSSSVVVGRRVFIVVPSVDISKDEDRDAYPLELIRFSF